ncbi:MAG: bacterial transcriptional activator domain-containing protein [Anaerolineae bacterium]|nr:bacterial transcriptional activator domain-containing protein [Anaerolineae bacterium]
MNTLSSFTFAYDQLKKLAPDITLVVLHPDFHGQHSLIGPVLNDPAGKAIFVATNTPDTPFPDLLGTLQHALQSHLGRTLDQLPADPQAAAEVVARAMNAAGNVTLILDAFDLAASEDSLAFVAALVQQLASGCRVLISTRELPMPLLKHAQLQDKVALVPTHPNRMILDYAQPNDQPVLEVRALGTGRVLINGRLIDHWDGVLPRMLFFYFVDRGMTTRDEIFRTFWPKLNTREATNVFHVTKRKISEILQADLTVYWSGFYRVSPDLDLQYDVVKFAEAVQNAAVAPDDEAITLYKNAIALYNGPFLAPAEQKWILRRRDELLGSYAEALAGLARIYRQRGNQEESLGYFLRASATSPQREDLARAVMTLYRDLDHPAAALDAYARLEAKLRATLNVSPDRQTVELAETIRATLS